MFKNYFSQELKEGEKVVHVIKKHWITFSWSLFKVFIILLIPFLLIYFLFATMWGTIVFFVIIIIGLVYGVFEWVNWYFDSLIITNKRIIDIDQKSIFSRKVSEAYYDKIQDVTFETTGFFSTMFNYGKINIQTAGSKEVMQMDHVENPKKIQEMIMELQQKIKGEGKELTAKELIDFISNIESKDRKLNSSGKKRMDP